jgi:hypothetical protein
VIVSAIVAVAIIVAIPMIVVRYEKRLLAKAEQELPAVIPGREHSERARNP